MMLTLKKAATLLLAVFLLLEARHAATARQTAEPAREGVEFFEKRVRPVLAANCYMCHSSKSSKPQGGLVLDSFAGMMKGGASGSPAIAPGDPDNSLLIKAVRYTDAKLQMPPGQQLPADQVRDLEAWVKMGAPYPQGTAAAPVARSSYDFAEGRKFWSFQPIKDHQPPAVKDARWPRSPVDRFILARLEERHLKPVADAGKRALIRRATFDLTGLPPTPDEVDAFLRDRSDKAFERVVDRLLASPHYGERWGRHWLDLIRYADTSGCNSDFPIPSAYKYRNYVINSFNDDKPYDTFAREQIAGDLMPAASESEKHSRIIATGYLALSRRFGSRNNEFHLTIEDVIDNLGKTFLGLSVSCARCHDHKFDPIPTQDYYALYGIFDSTRYAFPGTEIYRHTKDFVPLASGKEAEKLMKWQTELASLDDRVENLGVEKANLERKAKQAKAAEQAKDGKQGAEEKPAAQPPARTLEQVKAELAEVKARMAELENEPPQVEKAYAVSEGKIANARVHRKGDPRNKGDEVPRGFLQVLGGQRVPDERKGSGRLELAGWVTDARSPLAARVMVNRIWQYHFGEGLVQTPNDFGARGKPPTHPELLDYLATRFIKSGWSIKAMHKLVMLTRAYGLSSRDDAGNAAIDVNNDLLWRFNRRRLDGEEIRDAMLAVSGLLDRSMGGAHPFPGENTWRYTQHKQFFAVYDTDRRSVYLMQQRLKKHPLLEIFDGADTNASTAERPTSTTPIQALFMMNDPFVHRQADGFAVRVGMAYADEPSRIDYAYRLAFGRPATPSEIGLGRAYLRQVREELKAVNVDREQQTRAALASYFRILFSSNEFIFID